MNKIKRDERQYVEVDNFSKCEFSNNICFEMAIRNSEVQKILLIINDSYCHEHLSITFNDIFEKYRRFFPKDNNYYLNSCLSFELYEIKDILIRILKDIFYLHEILGREDWLKFYNFLPTFDKNSTKFIKNTLNEDSNIIDDTKLDFMNGEYDEIYEINDLSILEEEEIDLNDDEILNKRRESYFDDFCYDQINIEDSIVWENINFKHFTLNTTIKNKNDFIEDREVPLSSLNNIEQLNVEHTVSQNFSRPFLKPVTTNKFVTLENINLNLPEDELIEYIKQIRKIFNQKNKIEQTDLDKKINNNTYTKKHITSLHEIFYGKLHPILNTVNIKEKPKSKDPTAKNFINTFNSNKNVADLLYIYDAKKIGMKQKDIIRELSEYHDITKDGTTINKYYEFSKVFIDFCHYKKFLSGTYIIKNQ